MDLSEIKNFIQSDTELIKILNLVKRINIPEWEIGGGFIRSRIWDYLHGYKKHTVTDIDVGYFQPTQIDESIEKEYERKLYSAAKNYKRSVKNQARMHILNKDNPYVSLIDAIAHWPETANCIAVSLDNQDQIIIIAPYGTEDLLNMEVKLTPPFENKADFYKNNPRYIQRIEKWKKIWPKINISIKY